MCALIEEEILKGFVQQLCILFFCNERSQEGIPPQGGGLPVEVFQLCLSERIIQHRLYNSSGFPGGGDGGSCRKLYLGHSAHSSPVQWGYNEMAGWSEIKPTTLSSK